MTRSRTPVSGGGLPRGLAIALGAGLLLTASCSSDDSAPDRPDPAPEVDGGGPGIGSSTTTIEGATTGGSSGGSTQGNQIVPGDSTPGTASNLED